MTATAIVFYLLAAFVIVMTGMAVTRQNPVHAIVFLIFSFFGSALLFYVLGAPFLSALEIIIYAGAIMVLFLFVVMMLGNRANQDRGLSMGYWLPGLVPAMLVLFVFTWTVVNDPEASKTLIPATADPGVFGRFVFKSYWPVVEIISMLLLVGLIAAVVLENFPAKQTAGAEQGKPKGISDDDSL